MTGLPLLVPVALIAIAFNLMLSPVARDDMRLRLPEIAALAALGLAVLAGVDLVEHGPGHGTLPFLGALGFAVMMDVVSVSLMMTVSFVGWVVLRFSRVALDGETRHAGFMAFMSLVLAGVILLVTAGTLTQLVIGWIGIGVALRPLLLFYHDRPRAQRAAKKKAFFSMISVAALTAACLWMASAFGTTEIAAIRAAIEIGDVPDHLWGIALLLAVAAIVKSALIPTHGWLTEVMEAPTPVSALLHAGVVASGGFLLIRFADLMIAVPGVMAVLALVGGFSALIGAAVALTQPSVKTALAWSTCAQMGFMILQCGLALFPLALLHIIAHALYKAHAFLGSGSAVEAVNAIRRPGPVAVPDVRAVGRAFGLSLAIFVAVGLVFGIASKAPQAVALGAILVFGVAYLMAQALADAAPRPLTRRTGAMAGAATLAYFAFHAGADWLTAGTLPPPPAPDGLAWAVMALTVPSFALAAFAQATFPLWADHPAARGMRVHLMNGLYLNALADRFAGRWSSKEI